ncbi:MAG: DNA-binding protein [Steroidobacteraceae bacterium]
MTTESHPEETPADRPRHRSDAPYEPLLPPARRSSGAQPPPENEETAPERRAAGPLRARRISAAEVFAAADALLVEGDRPTIDRVRVRLGRGSPNTINEHLDAWWRQLGARIRDLPGQEFPQLPERVAHTLQLLWNEALTGAHEALHEAVTTREQALQKRESALAAREHQLEEERQALAARGSALEDSLALARAQLGESNQRAAALEQALRDREESLGSLQRRLEPLEAQAASLADRLQTEQQARIAERAKFDERYEAAERRWLTEVDQARERLKVAEKQARADTSDRARLNDELQRAKREALDAVHELKTVRVVNAELRERIKAFGDHSTASTGRRRTSRRPQRTASPRKRANKTP